MPNFDFDLYEPAFPFRNKHINTIFPSLFRNVNNIKYSRKRMITSDSDFIDLDYSKVGAKKAAILCHGLEGNAQSKYIMGMARHLNDAGFDTVSVNYRGCSGEMNLSLKMYNSGATDDLHEMISFIENDYSEIHLIGFSLGGNLILKYLGEDKFPISNKLINAVAFSTPCDLESSVYALETPQTLMYRNRFISSLGIKIREKHKFYPDEIKLEPLQQIKTLVDFDDHYTAPIHGYKDAKDYYDQCNCRQFLSNIKIPALLVNAKDDPFLTPECMPSK
jgi:predicted alpha/beta-fold hydrolase